MPPPNFPEIQTSFEELYPLMRERLDAGGEIVFSPKGKSMRPFLRAGRDRVVLVRTAFDAAEPNDRPQRGDILLYRRSDGSFVLHRFIGRDKNGSPIFCGDAQAHLERGVASEAVIARVAEVLRGKQRIVCRDHRRWRWAGRVWIFLFPARSLVLRVWGRLRRRSPNDSRRPVGKGPS